MARAALGWLSFNALLQPRFKRRVLTLLSEA
jgi:hypothetical protein